jgi:hypothetical protein
LADNRNPIETDVALNDADRPRALLVHDAKRQRFESDHLFHVVHAALQIGHVLANIAQILLL